MILHYVDLADLFNRVKLVSKRFYSLIGATKFDELIVNFGATTTNHWYHSCKPVNPKNIICSASRDFLQSPAFSEHFAGLRCLKISSAETVNFHPEQINRLKALEQLDLHIHFDRRVTLSLPYLRRLAIFSYSVAINWSQSIRLVIDCDQLQTLSCNDLTDIELMHPASLLYLEVGFYHLIDLNRFSNLQKLRFNNAEMHLGQASGLTRSPKSLKRLELFYSGILTKLANDTQLLAILEQQLPADAEVYLNEVRWLRGRPLADYGFELNELQLYQRNWTHLSDRITRCLIVSYDELLDAFDQQVPADFAFRFVNIQNVIANRMPDPGRFLRFLGGCSVLRELELNEFLLERNFCAQLPKLLKVLMKLKLNECDLQCDLQSEVQSKPQPGIQSNKCNQLNESNLDFLLQFNLLFAFSTSQRLSTDFSLDLFRRCRFMRNLQFKRDQSTISISKTAKNQFDLQFEPDGGERWTGIDLERLTELIKR